MNLEESMLRHKKKKWQELLKKKLPIQNLPKAFKTFITQKGHSTISK